MVKIYKQPFAREGDTIAIPDASQPDGKMSSTDGWTPDYQLPKTDPNYKPVGRQEMNGVFKEVTESLGQVQVQGSATWSPDGAPYPINAQVYHNGKQWIALRANSVVPAESADWSAIGTAATRNVGEGAGQVMEVGAFGWGATNAPGDYHDNADLLTTAGFYRIRGTAVEGYEDSDGGLFTMVGANDTKQIGWDTVNVLRFRGNENPADAPAGWSEWLEIATTNQLLGAGQTWQVVTGSRNIGTTYTNTTGRPIYVATTCALTRAATHGIFVDGIRVQYQSNSDAAQGWSFTFIVPAGSTYKLGASTLGLWAELR